jgi:AGCS family alanine or glycine:cation symporter
LIILSTGIWNRAPDIAFDAPPEFQRSATDWVLPDTPVAGADLYAGESLSLVVQAGANDVTGNNLHRVTGVVVPVGDRFAATWDGFVSATEPVVVSDGIYRNYVGATMTAKAFDSVTPGLGKWVITIAVWLFALSTMISWSYYGEQCVIFMGGEKPVLVYKLVYCLLIVVATLGFVKTSADLDNVIGTGTGIIMFANIPILWMFGYQAMRAYKDYIRRLKAGEVGPDHPAPNIEDLLSGRDVER